MRRREFITILGGAGLAWPLAAQAQLMSSPVIGFLHLGKADAYSHVIDGFRTGLREGGYVESQNVEIEFRWANAQVDRLPELAADLVRHEVAVIVAGGGPDSALAAKSATSKIPIVIAFGGDPVRLGLVTSLGHPGGNIAGVTFITAELVGKRFELLCELVPHASTLAYIGADPMPDDWAKEVLSVSHSLGRELVLLKVASERDFGQAFTKLVGRQASALFVGPHALFTSGRSKVIALAAEHKVPAIYNTREFTLDGGLISYGPSQGDAFRQAGGYVASILKGTKPTDLPIQQATRFELVINLKTAKALGLTVPPTLLARADEVIE